jgi:hypothetical protein
LKLGCTILCLNSRRKIQDMLSFAWLLKSQRSFKYSVEVLEVSLKLAKKTLDSKDPLIFEVQYKLARSLRRFREVEKIETLFQQNIGAWIKIDGDDSDSAMENIQQLKKLLMQQGRNKEALEWPFKMFKYSKDTRGMLHLTTVKRLEELLMCLAEQGELGRILKLLSSLTVDLSSLLGCEFGQPLNSLSDAQPVCLKTFEALVMQYSALVKQCLAWAKQYLAWAKQYLAWAEQYLAWAEGTASTMESANQENGEKFFSQVKHFAKICNAIQEDDIKDYLVLEDIDESNFVTGKADLEGAV